VAIELKLGHFAPADKGQMELYLAWLNGPKGKRLRSGSFSALERMTKLSGSSVSMMEKSGWLPISPKLCLKENCCESSMMLSGSLANASMQRSQSEDKSRPQDPEEFRR